MKQTTIVEPILFAYMFCLFSIVPLQQQLVFRKTCAQHYNHTYCQLLYTSKNSTYRNDQDFLQRKTSQWDIYSSLIQMVPGIVSTFIFVGWSNRVGRKWAMIAPILGGTILTLTLLLNSYFTDWPLEILLIGTFLDGCSGQFVAVIASIYSYAADITTAEQRTKRTVILESMMFLSGVLSAPINGILLQKVGFFPPFALILAMFAFQIVYWFFLEESYKNRSVTSPAGFKVIVNSARLMFKKRTGNQRRTILLLYIVLMIILTVYVGFAGVALLYTLRPPINFTPTNIGYWTSELNATKFFGATLVNYFLLHKLKWTDIRVLIIYAASMIGLSISTAFSDTSWKIFVASLWGLGLGAGPGVIRGRLSKMVGKTDQGSLFAFIASTEIVVSFAANIIFNAIYKATVESLPAAVFFICAGISLIALFIIVGLVVSGEDKENYDEIKESESDSFDKSSVNN